jgi:hypothetical protein
MRPARTPIYALLAANTLSFIAEAFAMDAIPWFVLELTGSQAQMGLVGFFTFLPRVIATFLGAHRLSVFIGPVVAGFLIAIVGTSDVLWLNAVVFGLSALLTAAFIAIPLGQLIGVYAIEWLGVQVFIAAVAAIYMATIVAAGFAPALREMDATRSDLGTRAEPAASR